MIAFIISSAIAAVTLILLELIIMAVVDLALDKIITIKSERTKASLLITARYATLIVPIGLSLVAYLYVQATGDVNFAGYKFAQATLVLAIIAAAVASIPLGIVVASATPSLNGTMDIEDWAVDMKRRRGCLDPTTYTQASKKQIREARSVYRQRSDLTGALMNKGASRALANRLVDNAEIWPANTWGPLAERIGNEEEAYGTEACMLAYADDHQPTGDKLEVAMACADSNVENPADLFRQAIDHQLLPEQVFDVAVSMINNGFSAEYATSKFISEN